MSEYQYYEFQVVDQRLSPEEMKALRSFSTRAKITRTSFVVDYEWGSFKGDETEWMNRRFDAFLYFSNWGSRLLELAVSSRLLAADVARPYCRGQLVTVRESNERTIVSFDSENEGGEDEFDDQSGALSGLIPIREQLAGGDLRSLYIGWLCSVQAGEIRDEDIEPPIPCGMKELDGALEQLVDFLRIDRDLLAIAASASEALRSSTVTAEEIRRWTGERDREQIEELLVRFIRGEEPALATHLLEEITAGEKTKAVAGTRTVGDLLGRAREVREQRRRAAADREAHERRKREEEEAVARQAYLHELAQRVPAAWADVQTLIARRQPSTYDGAVALLTDLKEAATISGLQEAYARRLAALCEEHARKPSLLAKMRRAGLPTG